MGDDVLRLFLLIVTADVEQRLAIARHRPQDLLLARPVVGDQAVGRGEDVAGRAVIALELDHPGAGKVFFEVEDIAGVGATPGIDRLVIVADHAEVSLGAGQMLQHAVLGLVGILVLVDHDVAELPLKRLAHRLVFR